MWWSCLGTHRTEVLKDVGANKPYDLHLTRGDEKLHVEVKGTTSDGRQIILTRPKPNGSAITRRTTPL
ncbi:DUF3883 domain-containing protein [Streptomyces sp. NBC_01549]|uniref:protein NO VEIN domain-containing protein n=1 Tax=Streptomyces sp. NBC_01549 TaxID=2975874 RepID=UPI00339017A0